MLRLSIATFPQNIKTKLGSRFMSLDSAAFLAAFYRLRKISAALCCRVACSDSRNHKALTPKRNSESCFPSVYFIDSLADGNGKVRTEKSETIKKLHLP